MTKNKNFLITYSGRVGSTALIDTLKEIEPIVVPIFEELDYFTIESTGQLGSITDANVHEQIDAIYSQDRNGLSSSHFIIGFKWRIWGDMTLLAPVLKRHNVLVLNMSRADIAEFIASLYMSDIVHGDFNAPQFLLRDAANEAERDRIRSKYRNNHYEVNIDRYFSLAKDRLSEEENRLELLAQLVDLGIPVFTLLYEDFAYKRYHFLEGLLAAVNQPPLRRVPITKLSKVSTAFPSELMLNRESLLSSDRLHELRVTWEKLLYDERFPLLPLGRPMRSNI